METKNKMKKMNFFVIGFMFVILSSSISAAFSVGFSANRLGIYPDQDSLDKSFSLQNYGDDVQAITVEVIVEDGEEYVSFIQGLSYDIPAQSSVSAPIKITPPANARIGDVFSFTVLFKSDSGTSPEAGEGANTIGFNINQRHTIEVEVVERPTGQPQETPAGEGISMTWWILGIVAIIIVVAVIWFIAKNKKEPVVESK